jgi:hypothetical protein
MAWSTKTEAFFARLWVAREPLVMDGGTIDRPTLKLLTDSFTGEKNMLVIGDWAEDASDPRCYYEFFWGRGGEANDTLDILSALSEAAIRSFASIPSVAQRLKIDPSGLADNIMWEAYWPDLMTRLGLLNTHPIVRTSSGRFRYGKRYGDTEMFSVGDHMILIKAPPTDQLHRLKKLARAASCYEELRCGLFRGSAYAIDWLLQDYEEKREKYS